MNYSEFLQNKLKGMSECGFKPKFLPDFLFPFQRDLDKWAIRKGRSALFADCGLGKTPISLVWAENVLRHTNKSVLILTPLSVSAQTIREGEKFKIDCQRSKDGVFKKGIVVTNYERLKNFNPDDFGGCVLDESSVLKGFERSTRKAITDFMNRLDYRLLCSATPAPNDFMELGCSSEALGTMKRNSMLAMFFTNDQEETQQWRLKGHAKQRFWQWVASWARALRKPSDLGHSDDGFVLPPLNMQQFVVRTKKKSNGLLPYVAKTLDQQRAERRDTMTERCEKVVEIIPKNRPFVAWCHLNQEGDLLEEIIPGAVQVAGSDKDEVKEERLVAFVKGEIKVLVTKPEIAGFGMNWQHCADMSTFPSHSFERQYQMIRRCWRFGQKNQVNVNIVTSQAECNVMKNLLRKERQAEEMYNSLVREINSNFQSLNKEYKTEKVVLPSWL